MPKRDTLVQPAFRRSTNISLNHRASQVPEYMVSPCALGAFERITARLFADDGQRAWTITGPYGTGKSSFAAFLSAVLAGKTHPAHAAMTAALEQSAPKVASDFRSSLRRSGRLIPVLTTGSRDPIGTVLARACVAALGESCNSSQARKLRVQISVGLSDGERFDPADLVQRVQEVVTGHEDGAAGVVFIIDELGKLLEFAAHHPDRADVFSLQQMAEYAATANGSLSLIGILHQDFAAYSRGLAAEEKLEWEKIRGRFEDILFDEPADQMLRLLARSIRSGGPRGASEKEWQQAFASVVAAKGLPAGIAQVEAAELLKQCWPLHPLTALIVGPVFKRYGQNERSAFTFVQSHEPFSLRDFTERAEGRMYLLSDLYEYITSTYGDGLVANRDGKHWAEAIDIERRLTDVDAVQIIAFRTTALLSIIGRWSDVIPTPSLIEAALTPVHPPIAVAAATSALQTRSFLVVRKFNNTFALWEGSDVDVEERLALARAALPRTFTSAAEVAKHVRIRPLIARRHSFETGTLRVFPVTFANGDGGRSDAAGTGNGDGQIVVVLAIKDGAADSVLRDVLSEVRSGQLVVVPSNSREMLSLAQELACIDWIRRNTPELASDATARRELDAREGEVRRRLSNEQAEMLFGDPRGTAQKWYRLGKPVRVRDSRELNELLSTVCDELFPAAPIIRNEIINRSELSSSAAAARRNLVQAMIEKSTLEGLGISGNPPERSIYLSVLRELGLHVPAPGGHMFSADPAHSRNNCSALLSGIHEFFDGAERERKTIAELFALLHAPPYGVRAGVLPVILCAILLASESDVALYEAGAFIPQLSIEVFERLMKAPETFSVRRWTVTGVRAAIFGQMSGLLGNSGEARSSREQVLNVVKPLLRFYRRLDSYSQNSRSVSERAVRIRQSLAGATEPDQLLFVDLPIACGVEPFADNSKSRDHDVTVYVGRLREGISELQRAYDALILSIQKAIAEAFGLTLALPQLRKRLVERARAVERVVADPEMKTFVRRLFDSGVDDRQWIESVASLLAGKPTAVWNDDDRSRFEIALSSRVRRFQSLEALLDGSASANEGESVVRVAVAGSGLRDHELVVHLSTEQVAQTVTLSDRLRAVLGVDRNLRHRNVILASLARLIEETANDRTPALGETT